MFNGMMKSEIKKAETAANKFFGRKDCRVTAYYAEPSKTCPDSFYDVHCEICFGNGDPAEHSVLVCAFMVDRRRSFATVKNW